MLPLLLLFACLADRSATRAHPPRGYDTHGIDVSHHQGWIDWSRVAESEVSFAFIKATEGTSHVDRRFAQNWANAKGRVSRGAYHYFSACRTGAAQAEHFLSQNPEAGELPAVLDVEEDSRCNRGHRLDNVAAEVDVWLDAVEKAHGKRPLLYGSRSFLASRLSSVDADRWVASYSRSPRGSWTYWQYTAAGRVPGIAGPVDRNVLNPPQTAGR